MPAVSFNGAYIPTITSSLIQGSGGSAGWNAAFGTDGGGNLDSDPHFVNPGAGDYHLQAGSPAVDAGNNALNTASTDLDGNPRVVDGNGDGSATIDLGTYEYQGPPPGTNLVANGSFEEPYVESNAIGFYTGDTFGGWTVDFGSVDLNGPYAWISADSNQSLDLSGDEAGAIYQDLATQRDGLPAQLRNGGQSNLWWRHQADGSLVGRQPRRYAELRYHRALWPGYGLEIL